MVKITIGNRFIKPDGSVGYQSLQNGQLTETDQENANQSSGLPTIQIDNLVTNSSKLSTGHLVLNQMRASFDQEIQLLDKRLKQPGNSFNFENYKTELSNASDRVRQRFFRELPQDGLNGDLITSQFQLYVDDKLESSKRKGRSAAVVKTKEEFWEAYKQLYNQASAADTDMSAHFLGQIENLTNDAELTGSLSSGEVQELKRRASQELVKSRVEGMIENDPHSAREFLDRSGSAMGLDEETLNSYKEDAAMVAAQFDRDKETNQELKIRVEKNKLEKLYKQKMHEITKGEYRAIELLNDKNKFTPTQYKNLQLQINDATIKQLKKDKNTSMKLNQFNQALSSNDPAAMGAFSQSDIDSMQALEIRDIEMANGRPATLREIADITSKYAGKQSSRFTSSLKATLNSGNEEAIGDALLLSASLTLDNPALLLGLDKDQEKAVLGTAAVLKELPPDMQTAEKARETYNLIKSGVLEKSKELLDMQEKNRTQFLSRFNKEFNINSAGYGNALNKITAEEYLKMSSDNLKEGDPVNPIITNEIKQAFNEILQSNYAEHGDSLRKEDIYNISIEQVRSKLGKIPGSDRIIPNAPDKEFGVPSDGLFGIVREDAAKVFSKMGLGDYQDLLNNIEFTQLNGSSKGLMIGADGNPYRVYRAELNKDGQRIPLMSNGQPVNIKVSRNTLISGNKSLSEINKLEALVSNFDKQIKAQTDIAEGLKSTIKSFSKLSYISSEEGAKAFNLINNITKLENDINIAEEKGKLLSSYVAFLENPDEINQMKQDLVEAKNELKSVDGMSVSELRKNDNYKELFNKFDKAVDTLNKVIKHKETVIGRLNSKSDAIGEDFYKIVLPNETNLVSSNPTAEVRKQLSKAIDKQNQSLRSSLNKDYSKIQELENEYQQLVQARQSRTISGFNNFKAKIEDSVQELPDSLKEIVKNTVFLSTDPRQSGRVKLPKETADKISTFLMAIGANSSQSKGVLLRAVGNHIENTRSLPQASVDYLNTAVNNIASELTKAKINGHTNQLLKKLESNKEVYDFFMRTSGDNKRNKEFKDLISNKKKLRDTVILLQNSWNDTLSTLSSDKLEDANKITNILNDLQFKDPTEKELEDVIAKMASVFGIEVKEDKKKKTKNRFLGGR